ncbi:hypothetical protein BCV70DRAFT_201075 [Testicularia cyperi]|uniref:Programmed cell death protein 2 C-terminal domain-containing protein n=1 Tax=Testicularia cyperi TaxID=1882483 RepID=A0A317XNR7_9BASI|nr:hypothetical protein BCV70DRAFT_201075 [Testicularia cyperi]
MPRPPSDDGYDSDSGSEFDASDVQLGLADGPLEAEDEQNPLVSRIGGRAAWLPMRSTPPMETALCKTCNQEMQLLVQIFAPLEGSAFDRCLMVWGCARAMCQRTDASSLRVIRILKHNPRWAAKLEKQKAKREAREKLRQEREAAAEKLRKEQEERAKVNPFSSGANAAAGAGLGGMLFGGSDSNPFAAAPASEAKPTDSTTPAAAASSEAPDSDEDEDDYSESEEESESERLAEELAIKSALESNPVSAAWVKNSSHYPALYLNTIPEPSSSSRSKKLSAQEAELLKNSSQASGVDLDENELKGFAKEGYEKMLLDGIDDTFERFVKRVSVEGRQVVRYEFGGEPIPFHAKGVMYNTLWPKANDRKAVPGEQVAVTKSQFKTNAAIQDAEGREYSDSRIPACPACGGRRTFEAQLMPNLINLLKPDTIVGAAKEEDDDQSTPSQQLSEQDRRKLEIERALGRKLPSAPSADGTIVQTGEYLNSSTGLVWSTAFIYVCENDCCVPNTGDSAASSDECWREEFIAAQFEDE